MVAIRILALLAIGIVMVYSAGSVLAFHDYGDKFYFVKRQLFCLFGACRHVLHIEDRLSGLKKYSKLALLVCFLC